MNVTFSFFFLFGIWFYLSSLSALVTDLYFLCPEVAIDRGSLIIRSADSS